MLCLLLGASLVGSAPALAATQRGHVFSFAFGAQGSGTGQFSHPSGIAVNNATGDVYVADRENNRVEEFKPSLGKEGEVTGEEYVAEFAVPHPGAIAIDNCTHGSTPCTEGEDPSVGDVYVLGLGKRATLLYKFSPAGVPIGTARKFKRTPEGVAVGSTGVLFVYQESSNFEGGEITRFNDATENVEEKPVVSAGIKKLAPAFAVDAAGDFYVGAALSQEEAGSDEGLRAVLGELSDEYEHLHFGQVFPIVAKLEASTGAVLVPALDYEVTTAVAVNTGEGNNGVSELNEAYVLNVATVAGEQMTTVAAFGPEPEGATAEDRHGKLIERFGAPGLKEGDGVAVDSATGAVYVTDAASGRVDVFDLEPVGRPKVDRISATTDGVVGVTKLNAQVNPASADTHVYFEYGTVSCAASPGTCTRTATTDVGTGFGDRPFGVELQNLQPGAYHYRVIAENESGTTDSAEQTLAIAALVSGLPDGRAWEMVSPPNKNGAEPEAITREGGAIQSAADGKAITYVADGTIPAGSEPEGSRSPELTQILSTRGSGGWASQDIATANTTGSGTKAGYAPEYRFFSSNLALGLVAPEYSNLGPLAAPPLSPALPGESGQQETTIYLRRNAPLGPGQSPELAEERENYEKAKENGEKMTPKPNAGFLPLVTQQNAPGPEFGADPVEQGLIAEGATPDLSHVVFQSARANSPSNSAASGLYEWGGPEREQKLIFVSELPDGQRLLANQARLGGDPSGYGGAVTRHAISNDGSLVFWNAAFHLYARETALVPQQTIQIDTTNPGEPPEASEHDPVRANFQTANTDGSKVFFTDTQRLTSDSKAVEGSPDLYVFELHPPAGKPPLTDLTAQEGAGVLARSAEGNGTGGGGVIGASEDGSYIYFAANGALAPGAARGHCLPKAQAVPPPGTTCNLYVRHYDASSHEWEPSKLIAVLSSEDQPDWANGTGQLQRMTSRVSPNGHRLAFMSKQSLTGYDNEDVSSKSPGERLDEEVYLYDATGEGSGLVCASCDPTGARPRGVFDAGNSAGGVAEGLGLVVDRREVWAATLKTGVDHWLAGSIPGWTSLDQARGLYQSSYLSDSGRLFFNAADPLVAMATPTRTENVGGEPLAVGVENVYEYQPGGVGACAHQGGCVGLISSGTSEHESAFLDASENGNDVFFLTAAAITPQDRDTNFDVYDAHVCEAGSPCPPPPSPPPRPCEGEGCQGSFSPGPAVSTPASSTSSGLGNLGAGVLGQTVVKPKPLTRAQQLAAAIKACKSQKLRSKRLACETQARRKYGPTRAQLLASALKACKKDGQKAKRTACEASAHKRFGPAKPKPKQSSGQGH